MTIIRVIGVVDFVRRIVYVSSSFVYGNFQYEPVDENHPTNPKYTLENGIQEYIEWIKSVYT